jgi:hypothetical protein
MKYQLACHGFGLIGLTVIFVMTLSALANFTDFSYAQKPAASNVTEFVKFENEKLEANAGLAVGSTPPVIEADYESPQTLILSTRSEFLNSVGKVIDFAKQRGYVTDSTTAFTDEYHYSDGDVRQTHYIEIFMSKK